MASTQPVARTDKAASAGEKSDCGPIHHGEEIFSVSPVSVSAGSEPYTVASPQIKAEPSVDSKHLLMASSSSAASTSSESSLGHPSSAGESSSAASKTNALAGFPFNTPGLGAPYGSHLFPLPHR